MTKTTNYQLPQWEAHDPVRREDFNQAMTNIEEGLDGVQAAADAAQETADTKPYVAGTYTGTGGSLTFTLGFRPSFIIVCGNTVSTSTSDKSVYAAWSGGDAYNNILIFNDTGFQVKEISTYKPHLCYSGCVYNYIAFQ